MLKLKFEKDSINSKILGIRLLLKSAFAVLLVFLFSISLIAQTNNSSDSLRATIDSLKKVLVGAKVDTNKVILLNRLYAECRLTDLKQAGTFVQEALIISREIGYKKGIADAYRHAGDIHYLKGEYPPALQNFIEALKIRESLNDKKGIADIYNNIGDVHYYRNDLKLTLDYYLKALKLTESFHDKRGMAKSYYNIGWVFYHQKKYDQARDYYLKSLETMQELGEKRAIASIYNSLGVLCNELKDYETSLSYHLKTLKIKEELKYNVDLMTTYMNIGLNYGRLGKYNEAVEYYMKGINLAQKEGQMDKYKEGYYGLSLISYENGNYRKAYEYHELYAQIKDSLFNKESSKQIAEMGAKYESEKKEAQIQLLEKDKEVSQAKSKKQRIIIYSISLGLVLLFILSAVIFKALQSNRRKNKIITKQKQEVEDQKKLVELQKEEIAIKNKDLTDSILYAERIQRAILTSEQYLNDMFLPQQQISSHFILYKPKAIVAGDFYWAYKTQNGKAIWLAADCTGHGVPGAFMSMIGNSLLNEIVIEKGVEQPAEILNSLRAGIIKAVGQAGDTGIKDGMDCALCCWDKNNNKLIFSGANNSLWIVRKTQVEKGVECCLIEIKPDKQPVGNYAGYIEPFTQKEFELQPGDTLYTFTDGYADQFGGSKGKKFKYKHFKDLIISIQNESMPDQRIILNDTLEKWKGEFEQIDDICVFGVRV